MTLFSLAEQSLLEQAANAPMLAQVQDWAAINSGSRNLDGLGRMAGLLADAFAVLPGEIALVEADPADVLQEDPGFYVWLGSLDTHAIAME